MALLLLADGALPNVSEDVAGALRFDKAGLAIGVPFRWAVLNFNDVFNDGGSEFWYIFKQTKFAIKINENELYQL